MAPAALLAAVTMVVLFDLTPAIAADAGPGREPVPAGFAETIRVPRDAATIQDAVDVAKPGGMVLIDPGVYREAVTVTTPYITIRGMDRTRTIIDGELERANGIHVIEADGVTIENLTSRNHVSNGFLWTRVHGYWGSLLTAIDNEDHGIAADGSDWGQFDRSYASGSPGAGFFIGGCDPCHAVVTGVLAEHNVLGFSGVNAGGDLTIVNSEWRFNGSGIVPNSADGDGSPQRDALIAGNLVRDNDPASAGMDDPAETPLGAGILIAGGSSNEVIGNRVENHRGYGIAVLPNLEGTLWVTSDNEVRGNVVGASGLADLALGAPAAGGDCFTDNDAATSSPPAIELLQGCGSPGARIGGGDPAPTLVMGLRALDELRGAKLGDRRSRPAPSDQPAMSDPAAAPPRPAIPDQSVPQPFRVRSMDRIRTVDITVGKEMTVFGVPLATSWWSLLIGLYGYALPGFVYAAWLTIALWDLIRQESIPISFRARWMAVVILVPFLGPLLYFAFGRSPIPQQLRLMLTVGGLGACLLIAALAALLGG